MDQLRLNSPLFQPDWLPGETLFSLCARIHRLSCNAISCDTTRILFGSPRAGNQHDFPNRLSELAGRSRGCWGDVDDLINRTLLPYYLPFATIELARDARESLTGTADGVLKFRLGLLTGRFRAHHPLKACPKCRTADTEKHRIAYWHLDHQYPGALICPVHQEPLGESLLKASGVRRFDWCLPDEGGFRQIVSATMDDLVLGQLLRLTTDAGMLATLPADFHFESEQLYRCYRLRSFEMGYRCRGRVAWQDLAADYLDHCSRLRVAEPLSALPANLAECRRELERLLRPPRGHTHPIRHLALIGFLFPAWEDFMQAYRFTAQFSDPKPATVVSKRGGDERVDHFISLLGDGHHSCSKAASIVGISVGTAMAWAAQAGISVPRRAKALKPDVRQGLELVLRGGMDKVAAAEKFGIASTTVTSVLRTTPNLHEAWLRARFKHLRSLRRKQWEELQGSYPEAGIKILRELAASCYAWLYRNDRDWLTDPLRHRTLAPKGNHSRVNWDERDQSLAAQVEKTAISLAEKFPDRPIPLWALCQALPQLKAKIGHLDKLPLTHRALTIARRRRSAPASLL